MLSTSFLAVLMSLVADAPHLVPQFVQLYGDVAHGEGGGQKVAKVLQDAAGILTGVAPLAAAAQPAKAS